MRTLFGATDKGLVRPVNQDRFELSRVSDTLAWAVLCDGMGGENGGHVASEIAVTHMREALGRGLAEGMGETSLRGVILSAVSAANALVYEAAQKDEALSGMGTTLIAAVFSGGCAYIASVGDSRAYIVSPGGERQVSRDHTVVQMLVDIGEISEADAASHPKRHFITRAVGVSPSVEVDFCVETLKEGELALLCSDGLYGYLTPGGFYPLLERCVAEQSAAPLIELAKAAGGSDNITAVVAGGF